MYLVIASSNGRHSTLPSLSPRVITPNAPVAFYVAEKTLEHDGSLLSSVSIFEMKEGEEYALEDSSGTEANPARILVCVMWLQDNEPKIKCYGDFEFRARA